MCLWAKISRIKSANPSWMCWRAPSKRRFLALTPAQTQWSPVGAKKSLSLMLKCKIVHGMKKQSLQLYIANVSTFKKCKVAFLMMNQNNRYMLSDTENFTCCSFINVGVELLDLKKIWSSLVIELTDGNHVQQAFSPLVIHIWDSKGCEGWRIWL